MFSEHGEPKKAATPEVIEKAFESFIKKLQALMDGHPHGQPISFKKNKRYWRVMSDSSAYCFVERATGRILYPASWAGPNKKVPPRGNVLDDDPTAWFGVWGLKSVAEMSAAKKTPSPCPWCEEVHAGGPENCK